ncbi:MAG: VOC family protein [Nocardioides sp.]
MPASTVPGAPIWVELFTPDTDGAQEFYGELFGWTADVSGPEYGGYVMFRHDGEPVAGCMCNDGTSGGPNTWSVYLESNNAADTVEMAKANGGQAIVESMQVGDMGHMAVVADPSGAMVGIWQPLELRGISARGEVGAPAWFELHTSDYAAALAFYKNVFGWHTHTVSDTPDFRYTTLGQDDGALAGVMDASGFLGDQPSHWSFYVEVDDADASAARTGERGGAVVTAPEDTPYGRLATLTDPCGVAFKIMGPNVSD